MMSFQLDSGRRRWFIVGCYLSPDNASTINHIIADKNKCTRGAAVLVAGNSNINLKAPEGNCRRGEIVVAIVTAGFEDMSAHFLLYLRSWARERRTWYMYLREREVWSWMDYLLGLYRCMFQNLSIWDS